MKLRAVVCLDVLGGVVARKFAVQFSVPLFDGTLLKDSKIKFIESLVVKELGTVQNDCIFTVGPEGLSLLAFVKGAAVLIAANFHGATTTYRRLKGGGKGQMIARAVGLRAGVSPSVLDATAGLGGDAFVLASLGCRVAMIERVPVVRALLADGIFQAQRHANAEDAALGAILSHMDLVAADSIGYLNQLSEQARPDVIYLDPMFPMRTKSSLVKKEMRVFHSLVGADPDADQLLPLALDTARYRVVVKRPKGAACLNALEPSHVHSGKSNRYDVYTKLKMPDGLNV